MVIVFLILTQGYSDGIPIIFGNGYLILSIPTLFLHLEYYFINKKDRVTINYNLSQIIINNNLYLFEEIDSIILVMPPVWHRKESIRFLPFEEYNFAKIIFKNKDEFIFTNLLEYKIENIFSKIPDINIERKSMLISTTLW